MDKLVIEKTKATPQVNFDAESKTLKIDGQSYPENAFKFYEPIFLWIDEFFKQDGNAELIKLELSMPYINTSSSKCIMMLLEKFEEASNNGKSIVVNWYYDPENESELECAEELKEFVELEFNIIPR
ncbi:MAG: DUF1987 domain-containing protein [Bacillota bacterium]|nr:DUF1987 domain-containing protein [Bacillota bacterium]